MALSISPHSFATLPQTPSAIENKIAVLQRQGREVSQAMLHGSDQSIGTKSQYLQTMQRLSNQVKQLKDNLGDTQLRERFGALKASVIAAGLLTSSPHSKGQFPPCRVATPGTLPKVSPSTLYSSTPMAAVTKTPKTPAGVAMLLAATRALGNLRKLQALHERSLVFLPPKRSSALTLSPSRLTLLQATRQFLSAMQSQISTRVSPSITRV